MKKKIGTFFNNICIFFLLQRKLDFLSNDDVKEGPFLHEKGQFMWGFKWSKVEMNEKHFNEKKERGKENKEDKHELRKESREVNET